MTRMEHRSLLEALLPAVLEAGRVEMGYFSANVTVERKADRSPVTAADREAAAVLVAALSAVLIGLLILGPPLWLKLVALFGA